MLDKVNHEILYTHDFPENVMLKRSNCGTCSTSDTAFLHIKYN